MWYALICVQFSLMSSNSQCPFFEETFKTPNDSLGIEIAIEPFIETRLDLWSRLLTLGRVDASITLISFNRSLEVKEEEHQFVRIATNYRHTFSYKAFNDSGKALKVFWIVSSQNTGG